MRTEGPLDAPVTSGSVVGGATWGLRNGFDVTPQHTSPRPIVHYAPHYCTVAATAATVEVPIARLKSGTGTKISSSRIITLKNQKQEKFTHRSAENLVLVQKLNTRRKISKTFF